MKTILYIVIFIFISKTILNITTIDWNRQNVCFKFKVKKGKLGKLRDKWKLATVEKIFLYSEDLPSCRPVWQCCLQRIGINRRQACIKSVKGFLFLILPVHVMPVNIFVDALQIPSRISLSFNILWKKCQWSYPEFLLQQTAHKINFFFRLY